MNKKIPINYTAREFAQIKQELVNYAKRYYPDQFQDFNEAGFGSLLLDTVAYVGDLLSFYIDYQANESFLDTANELDNVIKLSRQLGYKFDNSISSSGVASFYILVPSNPTGTGPDTRYMPILKKNSTFIANNGAQFILESDVRFDDPNAEIAIGKTDTDTGLPTFFAIKSYGNVISGKFETTVVEIGDYKRFLKVQLPIENLVEIISVRDSEGFSYFEVENLAQDTIYRPITNRMSTNDKVDSILRPFYVPRRFVLERSLNSYYLQFGSGIDSSDSIKENQLDPSTVALKFTAREYISEYYFDPNKLLETDKMGIVPSNTILSVTARVNTADTVSIGSNTLSTVETAILEFEEVSSLDSSLVSTIRKSIEINNEEPIIGSERDLDTQDIKKLALSSFTTQGRAVTREDYKNMIYRMPGKFGSIKRVNVIRDQKSLKRNLNIYLLSVNQAGKLEKPSQTLKENIRVWIQENKMLNDTIDLIDGKIVNLGLDFQITTDYRFSNESVLANCFSVLREMARNLPEMGEPFSISDVYKKLKDVEGVLDVVSVNVKNKSGGVYSSSTLDIEKQRSPDNRYIDIPLNAVWEIKYPESDIKGVIV